MRVREARVVHRGGAPIEAFCAWNDQEPEPNVQFEVRYLPRPISLTKACGLVWNCSDILPGDLVGMLTEVGLDFNRPTYAAAARAMHGAIVAQRRANTSGTVVWLPIRRNRSDHQPRL